ncbi:class I SAM-dependent methyltransferase [Melioribacter sp. OK-6-Me]|uniref:class I SAM-dependent methyltransferase n=1 Tax=Melioribacter sp. OK-6-Me TaxID=3423433 RepID=UPI003EDB41CF
MLNNPKKLVLSNVKRIIKNFPIKIRKIIKPNPKSYKDIIYNYSKYLKIQTEKYKSHESQNVHWAKGQEKYIKSEFINIPRYAKILDIACGDGVGLKVFKELGFLNVVGVELSEEKVKLARSYGFQVIKADMHKLEMFNEGEFDIIYSSHTLEHAYSPTIVLKQFFKILKNNGLLKVVLPYPDLSKENDEAHGGKYELQTNINDNGESVVKFFENIGFTFIDKKFDSFREPEIWLTFKK